MRDVLDELICWWDQGRRTGIGTVVQTWRSAPRPPGAAMLVGHDGTAVGSVSGGCVEGAVFDLAERSRDTGQPTRQRYGVTSKDALSVGLTCGGTIDVFTECIDQRTFPELGDVAADVHAGRPIAIATLIKASHPTEVGRRALIRPGGMSGTVGSSRLDDAMCDDALGMLTQGETGVLRYGSDGERRGDNLEIFIASYAPRPRMIVFGAIDFAAAVARIGSSLGYRVTVCDARPTFATAKRFPHADEVVVDWPHRYLASTVVDAHTVICVLTHDSKFDIPLLQVALRTPLAFVGAMGSRRATQDRLTKLRELGLSDAELGRLHSPIGLDIGARTPEETAISIAAEIIGTRWNGTGTSLRGLDGPIHHPAAPAT